MPNDVPVEDFEHADSERRLAAVEALCDLDAAELEPHILTLVHLLCDEDEEVRATATAVLDMCSKSDVAKHSAFLLEQLDDESADVRLSVTMVLSMLDAESLRGGATKIIQRAGSDPEEKVRTGLGKIVVLKFSSDELSALISAAHAPQKVTAPAPRTTPSVLRPEGAQIRDQLIEQLNSVPVFCVQSVDDHSICAETIEGEACGTFFADVRDARNELAEIAQHNPSMSLAIQTMPLGAALAHSEKWTEKSQKASLRMRIQASQAELDSLPGFPELPDELDGAFSPLSSPLPVWECEAMHTATERPLFLHLDDLKDAWREKNGTDLDESDIGLASAGVDVIDLRELIEKMCSGQEENWECMRLMAPQLAGRSAKAMRQDMIDCGDLPPPLATSSLATSSLAQPGEAAASATSSKPDGEEVARKAKADGPRKRASKATKPSAPAAPVAGTSSARNMNLLLLAMCVAALACGIAFVINSAGTSGTAAPVDHHDVEPLVDVEGGASAAAGAAGAD